MTSFLSINRLPFNQSRNHSFGYLNLFCGLNGFIINHFQSRIYIFTQRVNVSLQLFFFCETDLQQTKHCISLSLSLSILESTIVGLKRWLTSCAGFSMLRNIVEKMFERIPLLNITRNKRSIGRSISIVNGHIPHKPLGSSESSSSGWLSIVSRHCALLSNISGSLFFLFVEVSDFFKLCCTKTVQVNIKNVLLTLVV